MFCDASSKAYAAVAYWRFPLTNNSFHVALIGSKSRVAPLKVVSIPRLELQAALLATRLAKMIADEHKFEITRRVFWSDSKTVLYWIKKDPREFKIFVTNRLEEIRSNSLVTEWKWVPTKENPADDGTRFTPDALNKDSRWVLGPTFLKLPECRWPSESLSHKLDKGASELRETTHIVTYTTVEPALIDFSRFSSWTRLLSTFTRVLQAIDYMKKRCLSTLENKIKAEEFLIRSSQAISFSTEINALKKLKSIPKSSKILTVGAFLDEKEILHTEGRLTNFSECNFSTNPIILDAKEPLCRLLIKHHHEKLYHGSHEMVVNELRQKFYIVGLRQGLRSIVSRCIVCKMLRVSPANPKMSALPPARLSFRLRPFTHCGLDYFGPMMVKIGRRREKRWGALFTCMTTRAIHIELAHSLSTDSAIMAFRRFTSRRGTPSTIYCDNGTNFRGMQNELKQVLKELDREKINNYAVKNNIIWKFNPPAASHMGGAWERLIRSVKSALSVVLKEQAPEEEVLLTVLCEIEHSVNSRPLTHVSVDPRDQEALTPNHFLLGASSGQIRLSKCDAQAECTNKQWRIAQQFADAFWCRWLREYLPTLISRKKWHENETPLKEGDLVLLLDANTERNQWRKGVVTRALPGNDGQVRVVEIRTATGVLLRPTRKLIKFA